jgi:hypothetical protein
MQTQSLVVLALLPLIGWRLYQRIRRLVGRQKSVAWRHWVAATLFPLLLLALVLPALGSPAALAALGAGVAAGVALAVWGLRLTRFERDGVYFYYTPSAHIGIGLSLLLACRILYRLVEVYDGALAHAQAAREFGNSPLTLLVFGMLAGYYASYAIGLLRWRSGNSVRLD